MNHRRVILVLFLLFTLSSCAYPGTPDATKLYAPYCIASQNVPFADNLHTHQWDKVSFVEQDEYGRKYYVYRTPSAMLRSEIEIHIISQNESEDGVYGYYEDACYIIRKTDGESFSKDAIAEFKIRNHWNLQIVEDNIKYTTYETANLHATNEKKLKSAVFDTLGLNDEYGMLYNYLEAYNDIQLFFIEVFPAENARDELGKYYLISYDENAYPSVIFCEEIPFSLAPQEAMHSIRNAFQEITRKAGGGDVSIIDPDN